jgi:hypothetical protein
MNKKILIWATTFGLTMLLLLSCMPVQAETSDPFIVYGIISVGTTPKNGVAVTIKNMNTGEELTKTTTTDDFDNVGYYSFNLGDMPSGWDKEARNETIRVTCTYGGQTKAETFTIPDEGTMYKQDVTVPLESRGGERETAFGAPGDISIFFLPILVIVVIVIGALLLMFGSGATAPPVTKRKKRTKKKK